jgi:hypothetical protein
MRSFELAIIKQISVHTTPLKTIEYILNPKSCGIASGFNVPTVAADAYEMFRKVYEKYADERFYKRKLYDGNNKIRLHHYIQSFDPKQPITPEEAHKIGEKWARRVFGYSHQVIISTHIDKGHIHNHFAVAAYDLTGKHWHSNKTTLKKCRLISNEICNAHGITTLELRNNPSRKYNEWLADNGGELSWKMRLKLKIDKLISDETVFSREDLLGRLADDGYTIRRGKYISVKAPGQTKAIRLFRLGSGYSEKSLDYRLQHRDREQTPDSIIRRYSGKQVDYAFIVRQIELCVYKREKNPKRFNHDTVMNTMEALQFMNGRMIRNETDWEALLENEEGKTERLRAEVAQIEAEKEKVVQAGEEKAYWDREQGKLIEAMEKLSQVEKQLAERREALSNHENSVQSHRKMRDTYLKYTTDTAYSSIQEKAAESRALAEKIYAEAMAAREYESRERNRNRYFDIGSR